MRNIILTILISVSLISCKNLDKKELKNESNFENKKDTTEYVFNNEKTSKVALTRPVPYKKDNLWGYYKKNKEFITEIIYDIARPFDKYGRAKVSLNGKWGVIDTTGKYLIYPAYNSLSDFINNIYLANYTIEGDTSYIFDSNGKLLSKFTEHYSYNGMEWLTDSLMPVKKDESWSLLNINTGKIHYKIPFKYVSFYKNYILVGNDKHGMIDRNGHILIPIKYNKPLDFISGLSLIQIENKIGFRNVKGEIVIPPKYEPFTYEDCSAPPDGTLPFKGGFSRVQLNGKYGYINTRGTEITEIKYDYASSFAYSYGVVQLSGLYGAIDSTGNMVIGFKPFQEFSDDWNLLIKNKIY